MERTRAVSESFQRLYKQIPIPLVVLDTKGMIVYQNPLMDDWLDVREDITGPSSIYESIHPEERELCIHNLNEGLESISSPVSIETKWIGKGRVRYVRLHASAIEEQDEAFIVMQLQDMTEQKQVQSLLYMKKMMLELIVKRESLCHILRVLSTELEQQLSRITYCSILLLDESRTKIKTSMAPNLPLSFSESLLNIEIGPNVGSCGTAMYRKDNVIVSNIAASPLWNDYGPRALELGLHACWSVPIFIDEEVIGSFALYHREPSSPSEFELEAVEMCAYLVGLAVERSQIEEQIVAEQERRFQALIDTLPDLVIFKDQDGRWLDVNKATIQQFPVLGDIPYKGKSNEELAQIFPRQKELLEYCKIKDHQAWETGEAARMEWSLTNHAGEECTFDFMQVPLYGCSGIKDGILVIGRDITEKKKEALHIEESEQKYKSLFEHNPNGIYSMDARGRITSLNASMQEMLGLKQEDGLQSLVPFIAPDYVEQMLEHVQKALKGNAQTYETVAIHKEGHLVFLKVTNIPIIVQDEIVGVYGIAKDITRQKGKEEELRQTKELLESLFHHSADSILLLSLDSVVQDINEAAKNVFGWEVDEAKGLFCPMIPEDRREELQRVRESIQSGKEVVGLETIRRKKDGTLIDVSITFSPLKDGKGNIIGMAAIARDISERKRTEELLSRSEKLSAIGQLAASIAHEIRNPLTSIKGFIQFFRGNIQEQFVDLMLSELERIELIVTEFLLLAKPHATHFIEKNINSIIRHTLPIIEAQAIMNKVNIVASLMNPLSLIHCDENKIKQVLINVFQNAIEAMPNGGTIHVSTELQENEVLIQVTDDGHGIPNERIKKLGEPFYSNKEKGTGLGLMVCFKIMEEHGGRMEFESKEGHGTTVRIFFPVGA